MLYQEKSYLKKFLTNRFAKVVFIALLLIVPLLLGYNIWGYVRHVQTVKKVAPVFEQAQSFYHHHHLDSAIIYFKQCKEIASGGKSPAKHSESAYWIARCYYEKEGVQALDSIKFYSRKSLEGGSHGFLGFGKDLKSGRKSLYLLAKTHEKRASYVQAKLELERAIELSKRCGDDQGTIEGAAKLMRFHIRREDWYSYVSAFIDNLKDVDEDALEDYGKEVLPMFCDFFSFASKYNLKMALVGNFHLKDNFPEVSVGTDTTTDIEPLLAVGGLLSLQALEERDSIELLRNAVSFQSQMLDLTDSLNDKELRIAPALSLGELYLALQQPDSAMFVLSSIPDTILDWVPYIRRNSLLATASFEQGEFAVANGFLEDTDTIIQRFSAIEPLELFEVITVMVEHYSIQIKVLEALEDTEGMVNASRRCVEAHQKKEELRNGLSFANITESANKIFKKYETIEKEKVEKKSWMQSARGLIIVVIAFATLLFFYLPKWNRTLKRNDDLEQALVLTNQTMDLKHGRQIKLADLVMVKKKPEENKVLFCLKTGVEIEGYYSLKDLEQGNYQKEVQRLSPHFFVRVNHSTIINKLEVSGVLPLKSRLMMKNGEEVTISREKKKQVMSLLANQPIKNLSDSLKVESIFQQLANSIAEITKKFRIR